jgi:hypothetical protein
MVNYGYFPVAAQLKVSLSCAVVGALLGVALRRSLLALIALAAVVIGLYLWGSSKRISNDLDSAVKLMVEHVLFHADGIRTGDDGFADAVHLAFAAAEDNSHRGDPVYANKAAVLALGIILGDERVARLARREIDPAWEPLIEGLRQRITLQGRSDSARHFWVSAALVVLMDETRATTIGMSKELLDASPGGSGFSFADVAANRAGILFGLAATRDAESARATQLRIVSGGLRGDDFCPEIDDLPEGITRDQFQSVYGGLGGQRTRELRATIESRMATRAVLQGNR